jgi:hypothetical protein
VSKDDNAYPILEHRILRAEGDFDVDDFVCKPFAKSANCGFEITSSFECWKNEGSDCYVWELKREGSGEITREGKECFVGALQHEVLAYDVLEYEEAKWMLREGLRYLEAMYEDQ